ncbi:MAG: hypothetical protein AUK20_02160 [Parcubacteria group bacterium CG2_30_45_37]|nr:MAG: hypothetical protein AUK20_02160 [Parcubacteria group bacterium CG2_30_45_37]
MCERIIFAEGDLALPKDNGKVPEIGGYLPSQTIIKNIFKDGPLPVKLIIDVTCTCGLTAGSHPPWCAISLNSGHTQILVLTCSDFSQIQCSGAHMKIVSG